MEQAAYYLSVHHQNEEIYDVVSTSLWADSQ